MKAFVLNSFGRVVPEPGQLVCLFFYVCGIYLILWGVVLVDVIIVVVVAAAAVVVAVRA